MTVADLVTDQTMMGSIPEKCKDCMVFQVNSLHPLLRESVEQQMELCLFITKILYEVDRKEYPVFDFE